MKPKHSIKWLLVLVILSITLIAFSGSLKPVPVVKCQYMCSPSNSQLDIMPWQNIAIFRYTG